MRFAGKKLILAALLASMVALPLHAQEVGVSATAITFGQAAALSGASAALGKGMQSGILAAFHEANAAGGVNGLKLNLVTHDDGYDPDKSVAATHQLIDEDKVFALIGAVGTPTANAAIPLAAEKGIPFIGAFTGAQSLRDGKWPNVVNVRASYAQETEAWIDHLTKDLGIKKIAAFYQDDTFGQAGLAGVKAALEKRKVSLVAEGSYPRSTTAVKTALLTIKEAQPEAVVMVASYGAAAEFIKLAKKLGIQAVFVNISFVGSDALAQALGDDAEGVVVTQVMPAYTDSTIPVVASYLAALKAASPDEHPGFISLEGYVVGRLAIEALKNTKAPLTRNSFLATLNSSNMDLGGLKLVYGKDRTQGSDRVFFTVLQKNGGFKSVDTLSK